MAAPVLATIDLLFDGLRKSSSGPPFPRPPLSTKTTHCRVPDWDHRASPSILFNGICRSPLVPSLPKDFKTCDVPLHLFEELETSAKESLKALSYLFHLTISVNRLVLNITTNLQSVPEL